MKTFRFHLQKILDLKEKEKEQAEWAFGASLEKKREEEAKLTHLTEHHEAVTRSLYILQQETCSAAQLLEVTRYRQAVDRAIINQQQKLYGCDQEVERCQKRLASRVQESQLWQRLRDKAAEHFEQAEKLREQKEMDEIGINRYLRRTGHA